jgi:hypothetical protein
MRILLVSGLVLGAWGGALLGCGGEGMGTPGADGGVDPGDDGGTIVDIDGGVFVPPDDAGPGGSGDGLEVATGCAGMFNPDQLLNLHLTMSPGDWSALQADTSNSIYYQAQLSCEGDASILVGARRKRSGDSPKVGMKIDVNLYVAGQSFYTLKKLSLESGISEGSGAGETRDLVAEYLGWRLMSRSGAVSGRAAFVHVDVNGADLGVYVNVEDLDKRFLRDRFGDDGGWLYKKSGSANDGYHTNETIPNPYADYFCFWDRGCAAPPASELAASLPSRLAIDQILRVGAVNAMMANTDSPLLKDNNYAFYDWGGGPRYYLAWDLDTTMRQDYDIYTGSVSGGTTMYTDVLFASWAADYDAIVEELLAGPLALDQIQGELDRAQAVAGSALDADPYTGGGAAGAVDTLSTWWSGRHADVLAQAATH